MMMTRMVSLAMVLVLLGSVSAFAAEESKADTVKSKLIKALDENDKASDKVKVFAKENLFPLLTNAVLVKEVKAQNDKKTTLEKIKKIDEEWKNAEDELDIMVEKTTNACALELKKYIKKNPAIVESFVMDNQGANVGQNALTSDYWQGDEAKWKNSYNKSKGGVDIGSVSFDKSANAQLQQVSLPIIDEEGHVTGAVTFGLNIDKL